MNEHNEPFAEKEAAANESRAQAEAITKGYIDSLMRSDAGRWLLGDLVGVFEAELSAGASGHNSVDSYRRGRQDLAKRYRDLVIKYQGHKTLDVLLKGKA